MRVLDQLDAEGEAVDDDPREPASEEAVADVVGERHADEEEEGGDGLARVVPVDLGHTLGLQFGLGLGLGLGFGSGLGFELGFGFGLGFKLGFGL